MEAGHPRHDISDRDWGLLAQHLPGRKCVGGEALPKKQPTIHQCGVLDIANRDSLEKFAA